MSKAIILYATIDESFTLNDAREIITLLGQSRCYVKIANRK